MKVYVHDDENMVAFSKRIVQHLLHFHPEGSVLCRNCLCDAPHYEARQLLQQEVAPLFEHDI